MMFFADALFAFIVSVILIMILAIGFKKRESWEMVIVIFLFIFFVTWAGGIWLSPFGPVIWDSYLMPFIIMGLLVSLLILALHPPKKDASSISEKELSTNERKESLILTSVFFWIFLFALLILILVHYL